MRKTIYAALLLMVLAVSAIAKDDAKLTKEVKVTSLVQSKFEQAYKGAENVNWSSTPKFQVVEFTLNGTRMTAFYNRSNEHVATTQLVKDYKEVSPVALKNLVKRYGGYEVCEIVKYTSTETVYFFNLRNAKESFILKVEPDNSLSFFKRLQ